MTEIGVIDDILMQIIFQEICTGFPPMSVIDRIKAAFGPESGPTGRFEGSRLFDVLHDGDSIFVVVSSEALIGTGSCSFNFWIFVT